MDTATPPIVGSAEPLTRAQTVERLRDLEAWGVDLSLICMSLGYTPTERVEWMLGVRAFTEELRRALQEERSRGVPAATHTAGDGTLV
jgi:hypothetical protein